MASSYKWKRKVYVCRFILVCSPCFMRCSDPRCMPSIDSVHLSHNFISCFFISCAGSGAQKTSSSQKLVLPISGNAGISYRECVRTVSRVGWLPTQKKEYTMQQTAPVVNSIWIWDVPQQHQSLARIVQTNSLLPMTSVGSEQQQIGTLCKPPQFEQPHCSH